MATRAALETYHHTQRGPWFVLFLAVAAVFLTVSWNLRHEPVMAAVMLTSGVMMFVFGASFQHLTVMDAGEELFVYFGPIPLFRKRIRYEDIQRVEIGRTTLLDGWGIHYSLRGGWVWNIWGRDCVVLHFRKGTFRIGTDDPDGLLHFLIHRLEQFQP